jgi:hypothetical protein
MPAPCWFGRIIPAQFLKVNNSMMGSLRALRSCAAGVGVGGYLALVMVVQICVAAPLAFGHKKSRSLAADRCGYTEERWKAIR